MLIFSILYHPCSFTVYYYLFGVFYLSKIIFSGFLQFKGNFLQNTGRLFAASLFTHVKEKVTKASAKHMGVGGGGDICKQSEQEK